MDFYNNIKKIRFWSDFLDFLKVFNLKIIYSKIDFLNKIKKFLGLSFDEIIVISNDIVTYQILLRKTPYKNDYELNIIKIDIKDNE